MDVRDEPLSVREMLADSGLGLTITQVVGRNGDQTLVQHNRVQRVGLALAGHFHGVVAGRVQVCGETEVSFLTTIERDKRAKVIADFLTLDICAVIVTGRDELPVEMVEAADRINRVVVAVRERTGQAIQSIESYLDARLAPRTQLHGVLVDVFGVGMLLIGRSGIGKSECALDLVLRGHRLVADDIVMCDYRPGGTIFGSPAGILRHHIEVRGLGILNIKTLFGVTAVRDQKRIDVVARLCSRDEEPEQDRLGVDDRYFELLDVQIREIVLPVRAGRDMAAIVEIAARDELSRRAGHHSAREFYDTIERKLRREVDGTDDEFIFGRKSDILGDIKS